MMRFKGFLAGLLLLLISIMFTLKMKVLFGWSPDLILPLLIASGFMMGFTEAFFIGSISAWILNWQPRASFEIIFILLLPIIAYLGRKFSPWRPGMSIIIMVLASIALWYLLIPGAWVSFWLWLGLDALLALLAAFAATSMLNTFYRRD